MVHINISATNELVREVERYIRTIKEWCRGILGTLPFSHLSQQLLIGLVQFVTMWLNAFPSDTGISGRLSPCELICRQHLDANKHLEMLFGTYCKVHDEPVPTNSLILHTQPAIAMGPTGNIQGSYNFFALRLERQ